MLRNIMRNWYFQELDYTWLRNPPMPQFQLTTKPKK